MESQNNRFPVLLMMHQFMLIVNLMRVPGFKEEVIDILLLFEVYLNLLNLRPLNTLQYVPQRIRPDNFFQYEQREGKDVFSYLKNHRDQFWYVTGETPETFNNMLIAILPRITAQPNQRHGALSPRNKLLLTLIWLRQYPTYTILSVLFDVSLDFISRNIEQIWISLWHHFNGLIRWPPSNEWRLKFGEWPEMPNIVGVIDGTSHEILMPEDDQHLYFSGHRQYHCLHTKVIIDNRKNICYVHSGFLGHLNDVSSFRLCPDIGPGLELDFPPNARIIGDGIYPNTYHLITPYRINAIVNQQPAERIRRRKVNKKLRSRRVYVEHVIKELKTFRCISSIYRHQRFYLPSLVELCAALSKRKVDFLSTL